MDRKASKRKARIFACRPPHGTLRTREARPDNCPPPWTHDLANLHRRLLRTRTLQHNSLRTFRLQPRLWTKPLSRPTAIPRNSAYPIRMIHQPEEEDRRRSCYTPRTLFLGETSDLLAKRVQLDLESLGILRPSLSGGDGV